VIDNQISETELKLEELRAEKLELDSLLDVDRGVVKLRFLQKNNDKILRRNTKGKKRRRTCHVEEVVEEQSAMEDDDSK
jgi:hypothetical protein